MANFLISIKIKHHRLEGTDCSCLDLNEISQCSGQTSAILPGLQDFDKALKHYANQTMDLA